VTTREASLKRGVNLEYFSLLWNAIETIVGLIAGLVSGSVALIGFALDSIVEASSATILLWRFRGEARGRPEEEVERRAIRMVAFAFYGLALFLAVRSVYDLITRARPEASALGIGLAIGSLIVMPLLAWKKRTLARELKSRALEADSMQTILCTYISAFLLVGLVANAAFGWWWADPVAALAIAVIAAREGRELLSEGEHQH
jgi:divalent metal cation (Fe/Co/Zn/Cd) transporter